MGSHLEFFVSPLPQHSPLWRGHDDGDDEKLLLEKLLLCRQTADVKPKFSPPRPFAAARCTVDVTTAIIPAIPAGRRLPGSAFMQTLGTQQWRGRRWQVTFHVCLYTCACAFLTIVY